MVGDAQPVRRLARWLRRLREFEASLETSVLPWVLLVGIVALLVLVVPFLADALGLSTDPLHDR